MTKELTKKEESNESVESFIGQAIASKADIGVIERLFALRTQMKAEKSKEAFNTAMAKFQKECPVIKKKKDGGKTNTSSVAAYKYAPIEMIVEQVRDLIATNGFSYSFNIETFPESVKATCIINHEMGHSENSSMSFPNGTKTNIMSASQLTAATVTFAKRYVFCAAFGITVGDEDNEKLLGKGQSEDIKLPKDIKAQISHLMSILGFKGTSTDEKRKEIKRRTGIEATDKMEDLEEIRNRLEVLVKEAKENQSNEN